DTATNAHFTYLNGAQLPVYSNSNYGPYGLTTNGYQGANNPSNSDFYAIYVYNRVLTAAERSTVDSYLSTRYALPVSDFTPQPITGTGSAKLTGGGSVSALAGTVAAGESVTFSMDYKTEGTVTGTPRMYLQAPTGAVAATTSLPLTQTTPGRYSVTMTAATAGTITAGIYAPTGAGVIHFDNVLIEKSTTAGTYFDGATTGAVWVGATNASASSMTLDSNVNTLTWSASAGATSYSLYRGATLIYSGTAVTFADTNRPWGGTDSYTVTATNAGGVSATSNTLILQMVPAIPILSGTAAAQTNTLTWAATTGADSYSLYRVGVATPIYTGTALTFDDTARPWGGTSAYFVRATNAGGSTGNSNTITLVTVPDAPTLSGSSTGTSTTRTNLATNPNFESNLTGWTPAGGASLTRDALSAPASIPGLLTSFNAGDLGYANGATVTSAPVGGSSGIGWNAQNGGPTYQTGGLNGQGYLRQTTGGTGLQWGNYSLFNSGKPSTIMYVARQRGTGNGTVLGSLGYSWWLGWYYSNEDVSYANGWLSYPGVTTPTTNPKIYASTYNNSTNAYNTYLNGAQLPVYSSGNYGGPYGLTTNGYSGGNNPSDSDFYAIYVYDHVLTTAERSTVDSYLSTRYSLPVSDYTAQPIAGTGAAKLTGGGDVSTLAGSVAAGESVTFSMDYKTEGTVTGSPRMYLQAPTGATAATTSLPLTQTAPGRYSVTMTAATSGTITAGVYAPSGGITHFDNILIEKAPTAGTYFDGATASATWDGAVNASASSMTVSANTNTLTWTAMTGATSYSLYRVGTATPIYTGTALTFDDTTRPWGTSSDYYVTASGAGGTSANSNTVTVFMVPFASVLSGTSAGQINTLTWTAPTGAASYTLYRVGTAAPIYTGTALTFDDAARPWGATNSYYVVASNTGGLGPNSNTVSFVTVTDSPVLSGSVSSVGTTRANQAANPNFESGLGGWTPTGGAALTRDTVTTPASVPGLLTSFNAGDLGAANGAMVTSIPSGGSSPTNWTVRNGGAQYLTGGINGQGYLRQTTAGGGLYWAGNQSASATTVIYVANQRDATGAVLGAMNNSWWLGWWHGNSDVYYANGWLQSVWPAWTATPRILTGTYDPATNAHLLFRDGTQLGTNGGGSGGPYGLITNGQAGGNFSNSDFYAIYVYNRVLTATERSTVDSYLSDRYSIPVAGYVAQPIAGSGSAKLAGGGSASSTTGPVAAGETLTFSMSYTTEGTVTGSPRMSLQGPAGSTTVTTNLPLTQTTPGRYSVTATAATAGLMTATVYAPAGAGVIHFDNILIEKAPTAGTYFDGNTPIATWDGAVNASSSHITLYSNVNTLTWTASTGADSYSLYRVGIATPIYTGTALTFNDTTRPWGTNSAYYVTATNFGGASANSNTVTLLTAAYPPTLSGSTSSQTNTLTWTAPTSADSYALYRVGTASAIYTGTALTFADPARPWGVTSDYYLVANNAGGASPNSNTVTLVTVPDAPTLSGASVGTLNTRANQATNPNFESGLTGWTPAGGAALTRDTVTAPASIPGLLTSFNAGDLGYANGATVTSAPSGGSSPLNWTAQNGGPTYQTGGLNGQGYLRQTTGGTGLTWANYNLFNSSKSTIIYVARQRGTGYGTVLGSATSYDWRLGWYSGYEDVSFSYSNWLTYPGTAPTTNPKIYAATYDNSTNAHFTYLNNTQLPVYSNSNYGPYGLTTNGYQGANNPSDSDFYAVYAYDHVLTTAERATIYSYLSDRYSIPVAGYVAQPIAGSGSAKLAGGGSASSTTGPVAAGETLTFSMSYTTEGTVTGSPRMSLQGPAGSTTVTTNLPLTQTTPGRYSVTATAATAGLMTATVYAPAGAGVIHFDNILIEKAPTAGTYFDGNTPIATWDGAVNASSSHITLAVNASSLTWAAMSGATSYSLYRVGTATA
ncbi:hypothetical protein, partial [Tessaracoccus sp.]